MTYSLKLVFAALAATLTAASAGAGPTPGLWPMWDQFKAANIDANHRVIDFSDKRAITTSEGQSYAMFFALIADDRTTFDKLLVWTEQNLAKGDITRNLPSWLWGRSGTSWGTLDSNNATDSDLWIAYNLLEAARIWNVPEYAAKAHAMMELLKRDVRRIANLGPVLLPGSRGFDHNDYIKVNPSYYPVFILRRFAQEDAFWTDVAEATVRLLVRTAPNGYSPDWAEIDKNGRLLPPDDEDCVIGSYNSIRVYMWAAMLAPDDPAYDVLMRRFAPMKQLTERMAMPPEKVNILTGKGNQPGSAGFGACLLEMLGEGKTADWIRTVMASEPIEPKSYYRNVLILYGAGFDQGLYRFDKNGRLHISQAALAALKPVGSQPRRAKPETPPQATVSSEQSAPEPIEAEAETPDTTKVSTSPEAPNTPVANVPSSDPATDVKTSAAAPEVNKNADAAAQTQASQPAQNEAVEDASKHKTPVEASAATAAAATPEAAPPIVKPGTEGGAP